MGSHLSVTCFASDTLRANDDLQQALKLADSLIAVFSDYDSSSEVRKLENISPGGRSALSRALLELLQISRKARRLSGGAFDVTVGQLDRLWRDAMRNHQFPSKTAVDSALRACGFRHWNINRLRGTVRRKHAHASLTFGGIAKGYIARRMAERLTELGYASVLVDAGGDLVATGPPPGRAGWRIAVEKPGEEGEWEQTVMLVNRAVATSGGTYRYLEHNGTRYSHILDPRTGLGVTHRRQVTAVAAKGETADWLATAASILTVRQAMRLAEKLKAGLAIAEWNEDGTVQWHTNLESD